MNQVKLRRWSEGVVKPLSKLAMAFKTCSLVRPGDIDNGVKCLDYSVAKDGFLCAYGHGQIPKGGCIIE